MSRMWWYTLGVLILWIVNSELRRVVEWHSGLQSVEVLAILPLVCLIPHLWSLTFGGGWRRLPPLLSWAAWIWLGGFTYALFISVLRGNVLPGSYDFIAFVFPVGIGLWIAADDAPFLTVYRRITRLLFTLATLSSGYGIIQYVVAPAWDVMWLKGLIQAGVTSFGHPEPFQIRVFSTFNAPGTFAFFLALMLLLALPELSIRKPILVFQVALWVIALGLSLVRTGWLMFALGTVIYLIASPRRVNVFGALTLTAVLIMGLVAASTVAIGNDDVLTSLSNRFATLSDLDNDGSRKSRQELYDSGPSIIRAAPFGQGLGLVGTSTKLADKGMTTDFDSGLLARAVEMGLPGAALYIAALLTLLLSALRLWNKARDTNCEMLQAVAVMTIALHVALGFEQFASDASGIPLLIVWLVVGAASRALVIEPKPGLVLSVA